MKSTEKFVLVLVASLGLLLAGCGGGSSTPSPAPDPEPTPQQACEAADGRWNSDGTCTSAADLAVEAQHESVSGDVTMAEMAVGALTAMSTDEDVTRAKELIAAARTALGEADLLSANQVFALSERLSAVDGTLATAEANIDEHRQMIAEEQQRMTAQRMEADTAIGMANTAVAGLSATSTDEEVQAAKDAIQAAKDAVAAAIALSMADRDALNARITPIETMLASTESDIADHRQMVDDENQRMAVSTAIDDAMAAVGALTAMSTDDEVDAAKNLIAAAKAALSGATSVLTAEQALALQARISTIESTLGTTEMAIAAQRQMDDDDAETQRVADVADARSRAMTSYMEADADATKAEAAAEEAEEASPGSAGAMAARDAATAARMAADAAKMAHDAIMDDMTKADADAQAAEAATQAGNANSSYMTAKNENDDIQTAKRIAEERQRVSDIKDATDAASDAATAARTAATAARTAATEARNAANDANAAYMRAMAARTGSDAAKTQADAAAEAATAAETAANTAEMAADAAEAAHMGIDNDGTAMAAEMAQETAENEQMRAVTQRDVAETAQDTAETAQGLADTHAMTHVLRLFLAANGDRVMDGDDDRAEHVASVGTAMATIAAAAGGNQAAGTTATLIFPGNTVDDPGTDADEFVEGMLGITVNVAGGATILAELRESRGATDLNGDGDTDDPGEAAYTQTAREIADLGRFQGYELWEDDGDDTATSVGDRARAIVFTNKQKGGDSVLTQTAATARSIVDLEFDNTNVGELSTVTSTGTTITGVTWTPNGEAPLMGTLSCTTGCSITLGADGAVTDIQGYSFTGSREAREAVTAAAATEDNDYLAFGLWLEESDDGNTDTFGAFAVGGTDYAVNVQDAVTGTATYSGNAAGAHHKTGEGVNWFHGNASLTANFGTAAVPGTISGAISDIRVNGGPAMSDSIYLGQAALTGGTATFNGAAFMGEATAPGASTHEFDGTWSGSFFGGTENDADTPVDESVTAPLATAGTFGVTMSEGTGDDMVVESFVGAFGAELND